MYGRRDLLLESRSPNHFFVSEDSLPWKYEPGNVCYELAASLVGIIDYAKDVQSHHCGSSTPDLDGFFARIGEHEEDSSRHSCHSWTNTPLTRVLGEKSPDRCRRVPTVSFLVEGRNSSEVPPLLDQKQLAVRFGHFYAYRLIREVLLEPQPEPGS